MRKQLFSKSQKLTGGSGTLAMTDAEVMFRIQKLSVPHMLRSNFLAELEVGTGRARAGLTGQAGLIFNVITIRVITIAHLYLRERQACRSL